MTVLNQRLLLIKDIKSILKQPKQLNKHWFAVIHDWINQFNGFVADYNGNESDENRLLEQLKLLLKQIPLLDDATLAFELSKQFEGLFWHATSENDSWNSTLESYFAFKGRHLNGPVDQTILDEAHAQENDVKSWLLSRLESVTK